VLRGATEHKTAAETHSQRRFSLDISVGREICPA
jgi:hypothetical protein